MTTPQLQIGDFVTPTVRLLRPLAEGGMGRVWVAEHLGLHSEVVVKLMAEEMAARPDGAARFAREAAVAAAIKSPHVVQVFDHGVTDTGVPYIVMELLEGKDLGAHLAEKGRMDPADVVSLVVQIGKALSRAHKASIVHRDIKPDNIFLCDTDGGEIFVKLLDFGTARREDGTSASRTTIPGQIMGTPYYMSPEQSVGASDVDERSDIWSLGVVAFEALTGWKPFDGSSVGAITIAIHGVLPKMTERVPELPAELDAWFGRACAQVPQDRFATVREATHALVEAVTGAAPIEQPTESVCFPVAEAKGVSTRPVTRPIEPLIASLPERGSERRFTTIAAGIVMAVAGVAMAAIVAGRSPAAPVHGEAPMTNAVHAPPPAPAPVPVPKTEEPVVEATPPPVAKPVVRAPAPVPSTHAAEARAKLGAPVQRGGHPSRPADAPGGRAGADDDLVRLTNAAAQHAEPAPAPAPPTTEPAAPPVLPP